MNVETLQAHASGSEVVLTGQTEAFTITGGAGTDIITGGSGIDTISGGDEVDTITGAGGALSLIHI